MKQAFFPICWLEGPRKVFCKNIFRYDSLLFHSNIHFSEYENLGCSLWLKNQTWIYSKILTWWSKENFWLKIFRCHWFLLYLAIRSDTWESLRCILYFVGFFMKPTKSFSCVKVYAWVEKKWITENVFVLNPTSQKIEKKYACLIFWIWITYTFLSIRAYRYVELKMTSKNFLLKFFHGAWSQKKFMWFFKHCLEVWLFVPRTVCLGKKMNGIKKKFFF